MKYKIIDCTLRDGGYINDWEFGYDNIKYIINKLEQSQIDIIEIGFFEPDFYNDKLNYSKYSNVFELNKIVKDCDNIDRCVFMIMHSKIKHSDLLELKSCVIKNVRYCFKKNEIEDAFYNCEILSNQGFQIFLQPAAIHQYEDDELINLIGRTNKLNPNTITIVDTYGVLLPNDISRIANIFDENLEKNINIGIHSHNNLQLSLYHAIAVLNLKMNREIYIDTCVLGFGRGAGNLCTELAIYVLDNEKKYLLDPIFDIISNYFSIIKGKKQWGYSIEYFMTAYNKRHPNDTSTIKSNNIYKINQKINKKIKAVIFDFDGTIADTSLGIKNAIRYVEKKLNLPSQTDANLLTHIGPPIDQAYKKSYNLSDELLIKAVNYHKEYSNNYGYKELEVYEGILEVLNYLKNNNILIGIATLKQSDVIQKVIKYLTLDNYFDVVLGANLSDNKTKQDILSRCLIELHCDEEEVIFVGDSIYDYNAAMKLGIRFISVGYGYGFNINDVNNKVKIDCLNSNQLLEVLKRIV